MPHNERGRGDNPTPPPIATLCLDAGGVLVAPNWQRVSDALARHGIHVPAAALRAAEPLARFGLDDGQRIADTTDEARAGRYMELVLERAGIRRSPAVEAALVELSNYHAAYNLSDEVLPGVMSALDRFSALGLQLVVASNANGTLGVMLERVGLARHFHVICDSGVEGVEKPDPRFFQIVLRRAGAEAATTLHVGDLYHVDVVGARRAGLQSLLLDPHGLYAAYNDVDRLPTLHDLADRLGGM